MLSCLRFIMMKKACYLLCAIYLAFRLCASQELNGLDPTGENVCSHTRRITQYAFTEALNSPMTPEVSDGSVSDTEEGPMDIAERPRFRVGVRTSTVLVYSCCAGWRRNGSSCNIAVCTNTCLRGRCVAPNTCTCDKGWKGPSCSKPCLQYEETPECQCPPGFTGPGCVQPCGEETYGPNCRNKCACAGGKCNPVNGICGNNYLQGITASWIRTEEFKSRDPGDDPNYGITTDSLETGVALPDNRHPLRHSGIKITLSALCGILMLLVALMVSSLLCGRWKQRALLHRKQSCRRAILPRQSHDGEAENVQSPERSITSASTMTQPNSYMYMGFNDQESMSDSSRGMHGGHDLSSLIDGYASYQTDSANQSADAIYEVKMSSLDEKNMFNLESTASDYTETDDIMIGPRVVPGKETSDTEEGDRHEEYEYPYVDCKPPEMGTQGCGLSDRPIPNGDSVAKTPVATEDYHTTAIIHPKRDGSTSSSEDYCQADSVPTMTEIPIDGTYTALIRHSEPEYSTTVTFSSPHGSPRDLSNIVGYVTSVSSVSFKHPPRPPIRQNTNELTNQRRPPSASKLRLHKFTEVVEIEPKIQQPTQGSYINDRVPNPPGKDKLKRPVPAPRARLLPAHLEENIRETES